MSKNPVAFMSYVVLNDQHENGRLTEFRERLSGEVHMQSALKLEIFQDRKDIAWGQKWQERINESLDAATFLIPLITPAFFASKACREEMERFLQRERELGRNDLILPVYYVECDVLSDEVLRQQDPLAQEISTRQYADWREFRFEPLTSLAVGKTLAKMARQIARVMSSNSPPAAELSGIFGRATHRIARPSLVESQVSGRGQQGAVVSRIETVPKTEIPTLVVDAFHRGDFPSLGQALRAAKPGARILVRPGLYREGILINKPVEILGDGGRDDIILEAEGKNVIHFCANMGRICNLTIRQMGGADGYCVDIAQGRLDLEDCDVSSQTLACIAIHDWADPRLRRNRIHDGQKVGVYIYGNGLGLLEDNEISANAYCGVGITEGSNPTLRRNRIHDGKGSGVVIYAEGQGLLEDNEIFANTYSGVEIKEGSQPTLRRNRIHGGKQCGVYVHARGRGLLEDNEIFANAQSGVVIKEGGHPTFIRNRIIRNAFEGIWVAEGGGGIFEGNDLRGNRRGAWDLEAGTEARVKRSGNIES